MRALIGIPNLNYEQKEEALTQFGDLSNQVLSASP